MESSRCTLICSPCGTLCHRSKNWVPEFFAFCFYPVRQRFQKLAKDSISKILSRHSSQQFQRGEFSKAEGHLGSWSSRGLLQWLDGSGSRLRFSSNESEDLSRAEDSSVWDENVVLWVRVMVKEVVRICFFVWDFLGREVDEGEWFIPVTRDLIHDQVCSERTRSIGMIR